MIANMLLAIATIIVALPLLGLIAYLMLTFILEVLFPWLSTLLEHAWDGIVLVMSAPYRWLSEKDDNQQSGQSNRASIVLMEKIQLEIAQRKQNKALQEEMLLAPPDWQPQPTLSDDDFLSNEDMDEIWRIS